MNCDYEISEIAYIEQLMDDLDLKGTDTIEALIEALESEED
jgi:hypothetical protein